MPGSVTIQESFSARQTAVARSTRSQLYDLAVTVASPTTDGSEAGKLATVVVRPSFVRVMGVKLLAAPCRRTIGTRRGPMILCRRVAILLLSTVCALSMLAPVPVLAQTSGSSNAVISDCLGHPGGLTGSYTVGQLRLALQVMPAETKEYTSCPDVINRALLTAIGTIGPARRGGGNGSGSFLPTPVIVVLVLLALGSITFAAISIRRR